MLELNNNEENIPIAYPVCNPTTIIHIAEPVVDDYDDHVIYVANHFSDEDESYMHMSLVRRFIMKGCFISICFCMSFLYFVYIF
jgi:hypothetical protein